MDFVTTAVALQGYDHVPLGHQAIDRGEEGFVK
jgi:hypothetical protein